MSTLAAATTISTANPIPHSFSVTPHHGLLFVIQPTKSYFHSISDFTARNSCNLVMGFYCSSAEILIVAPKTKSFAILPQEKYRILPLIEGQMRGFVGLGLLFDPSKSPYYKVFSFRTNDLYSEWVEVCGSETHTWKQRVKVPRISTQVINWVYWSDAIYWIRPHRTPFCFSSEEDCYGFNWMYKVPGVRYRRKKSHVMESNGHMHYVVLSMHPNGDYIYVYEVNNNDRIWFLKYEACPNPILSEFSGSNGTYLISLLGIGTGDRHEDSLLLFHVPGKMMVYRFIYNNFEVLVDFTTENYFEEGQLQFLFKDAHQFIHTLATV